jgi:hypothetical protein
MRGREERRRETREMRVDGLTQTDSHLLVLDGPCLVAVEAGQWLALRNHHNLLVWHAAQRGSGKSVRERERRALESEQRSDVREHVLEEGGLTRLHTFFHPFSPFLLPSSPSVPPTTSLPRFLLFHGSPRKLRELIQQLHRRQPDPLGTECRLQVGHRAAGEHQASQDEVLGPLAPEVRREEARGHVQAAERQREGARRGRKRTEKGEVRDREP